MAPTKTQLIAGSWRCQTGAGSDLARDIVDPVFKYDATFLPDGVVRATGMLTGMAEKKPVEMGYMMRAKWTLEGDTLRLDYDVQAATSIKIEGEVLDHSMLNKDFVDASTKDPSLKSAAFTVSEITHERLVLTRASGASVECERAQS